MSMPFSGALGSNNELNENFKKLLTDPSYWEKHDHLELPEEFKSFMLAMLQEEPTSRSTMADLISHPYMQGDTATQ